MPLWPADLTGGPFLVAQARQAGLRWDDLQTRSWIRLSRGQYAWRGLQADTRLRLRAVHERMPPSYAFSGRTAAWLLGLDMPPDNPIEVTVDREVAVRARAGIRVRRAALPVCEVVSHRGFRVTSPMRTVRDLGSGKDLVESVVAIDAALRAGLVDTAALASSVEMHRGAKGIKRFRRALRLAHPKAESPMETRLRVQLTRARLPQPCVQAELHDKSGRFLARVDLYYPDRRLVVEYDGETHRERLAADLRRQNALVNAGYHVLRFTAADLATAEFAARQVRTARAMLPPCPG